VSYQLTEKLKKYMALKAVEKKAKAQSEELKDEIAAFGKGSSFRHDGFKIDKVIKKGSVNYRKVVDCLDLLYDFNDEDLNNAIVVSEGIGSTYWKISEKK